MIQYLEVGKIINTHGIKGELKVVPLTDYPERFEELDKIYIDYKNELTRFDIEQVKYLKNTVLLKLKGIDDMTQAEKYKNCLIKIDRTNARKLPEGSFFICDLTGLDVRTMDGKPLGKLSSVFQTGSNDVFVVNGEDNREVLIPALKSVVKKVDLKEGVILVELPEGLVDDEV